MIKWNKVVLDLIELIKANNWENDFNKAIEHAHRSNIPEIADIRNLQNYLVWINDLLHWRHPDHGRDIADEEARVSRWTAQRMSLDKHNRSV